jgi:hypothetical protein
MLTLVKKMISILCPSRGRPELAKAMIDTALATAETDIEIILYLNSDDSELSRYQELIDQKYYTVGPDRSPAYSWNMIAEQATRDVFFLMGDDGKFITPGWDRLILEKFDEIPDKIACVYPIQYSVSKKKNPHFCLHRNWKDALGYFVPPHFWHWYVDTWTATIARRLNRYYCLETVEVSIQTKLFDETELRTSNYCNRERDHWMWTKTQRYLDSDFSILEEFIKNYGLLK